MAVLPVSRDAPFAILDEVTAASCSSTRRRWPAWRGRLSGSLTGRLMPLAACAGPQLGGGTLDQPHPILATPGPNVRQPALLHADVALTHTFAGRDPEPACDAAVRSLDVCQVTGYEIGAQRIRAIRARMPKPWEGQACLAALDERLAAA